MIRPQFAPRRPLRILPALSLALAALIVLPVAAAEYDVYLLAGQSNMVGFGTNADLPKELQGPQKDVMIFHGQDAPNNAPVAGQGVWAPLAPGHGWRFHVENGKNVLSDRFGIELTFAAQMRKLHPDRKIAIIKYACGGTGIDCESSPRPGCWHPDYDASGNARATNHYDHCLAAIQNAFSVCDIDNDGETDKLIPAGILWMQGESDADRGERIARSYEENLRLLMNSLRAAMRVDDLPVVIGQISDSGQDDDGKVWDFGEIVRQAQADFVKSDPCAALVTSTDKYSYSDKWHYDSAGFMDFGKQFAEAMHGLRHPK